MKINASILCASLFMALAAATGCSTSTSDVTDEGKAVSGVTVGPSTTSMATGASVQFTATLEYADGTSRSITSDIENTWNTSDSSLATVSSTGMVQALKVGVVTITADFQGVKGDQQFAVTP